MNKEPVTKEKALNRLKMAIEHKREIKESIEREFASNGKVANVVFV